jgi:signal transduction histidine kinase
LQHRVLFDADMTDLVETLRQYGEEKTLSPGEVLVRQGSVSDGVYYLKSGRLGAYREEPDGSYFLTGITPGDWVGEIASATGGSRTATVKAEEVSLVVHLSEVDFRHMLQESPALAAAVVSQLGGRLTASDVARVSLGRGYQRTLDRVEALSSEKVRLEEFLRLREELADMIVHDLRNPLGVIVGGLTMLGRVEVAEGDAEYVAAVLRTMELSARRMQRLVETLLDIARLEEGAMRLQPVALDLFPLVEEIMDEERSLAEGKGVTLENRLPANLPAVVADRDILQRVLVNLLDNGIKFTPAGGRVWVEGQAGAEDVQIAVVDTGSGVLEDERSRIFEKFTQARRQPEVRRGAGLGLAFCRMAVEAHDGRIWVEDGPEGKGSRFVFTIPHSAGG